MGSSFRPNEKIDAAYRRVRDAKRALSVLIKDAYPVGSYVTYSHGKHKVLARVTGHADDRLFVTGCNSGKQYDIGAYRLCE